MTTVLRSLSLLALVACLGTTATKDSDSGTASQHTAVAGCRSTGDCGSSGGYCFAPGEPNCPVLQSCDATTCGTDEVCLPADPAFDPCADAVCRERCVDDTTCRAGAETCDVPSGECRPIPCDAGFACSAHETCVPGGALHGCVRDTCTDDAGCSGGWCVKGVCYDALGTCGYQASN